MKKVFVFLFVLLGGSALNAQSLQVACSFDSIAKLDGAWAGDLQGGQFEETWQIKDSVFYGTGVLTRKGVVKQAENLRIQKILGHWVYIASVDGKAPVLFTLIKNEGTEVNNWTFENKEHDFPQRINYNLKNDNTLHVIVSGLIKGKTVQHDYYLKKVH